MRPLGQKVNEGLEILVSRVGERPGGRWRLEWTGDSDPWVSVELLVGEESQGRWAIWKRTGDVYGWPRTGPDEPEPVGEDAIIVVALDGA